MSMNKSIADFKIIKNKISDFKIELGRIKDEFTNAINVLIKSQLEQAREKDDKLSIYLFSDTERNFEILFKELIKTNDFNTAVVEINNLLKKFELDSNLQITLSNDQDIANFLNTYLTEYGIIKLYKNTKEKTLLDFDNFYLTLVKVEDVPIGYTVKLPTDKGKISPERSKSPTMSVEMELELEEEEEEELEEEEEEGEEGGEEGGLNLDASKVIEKLSPDEKKELEKSLNIDELLDSDIPLEGENKYSGDYFIRSFIYKKTLKNNKAYTIKLYAPITSDDKWLYTKSNKFIFAKTELKAENRANALAVKALPGEPEGFVKWVKVGGVAKHILSKYLPRIGDQEASSIKDALIAHNLNYSTHFFMREELSLTKKFTLAEEKIKKELKEDLNLFSILSSIYPEFANMQNQNLILYIDETTTPHKFAIDKNLLAQFNNFVFQKIKEIKKEIQSAYSSASDNNSISIAEKSRYKLSKKLDDLLAACKIRDAAIYKKFVSLKDNISSDPMLMSGGNKLFDYKSINLLNLEEILISNSFKSQNTDLAVELFNLTKIICFYSSNYINSFAVRMAKGYLGSNPDKNLFSNEEFIDKAYSRFEMQINNQIRSKISQFFNISYLNTSSNLYCRYMSSSINVNFLYRNAYNFAAQTVRLGWNYISCPTCKKNIYYSKYVEGPSKLKSDLLPLITSRTSISEESAKAYINPEELSDYNEERYSFFRPDGRIITTQELRRAGQQLGKDWDKILRMISSNNQAEHNLGIQERQLLLKSMGAKTIKKKSGKFADAVFSYKTKCPFSDSSLPGSLMKASESAKGELFIKDFSCGLSLNINELTDSDRSIEPYELHSSPFTPDVDPEVSLNEAITSSIQKGILTEDDRSKFINELRKRRSGGWKFSNVMFKCPCKFTENKIEDIKKYDYLVSPISAFFTNDLYQKGLIHPPSDPFGELSKIEDFTSSYLICGSTTSISSFCRDTSDQNSLYGILKVKMREAITEGNRQSAIYLSNFIDILLQLGVDFNDILPFMDKVYTEEVEKTIDKSKATKNISLSHKRSLETIIKKAIQIDLDRPVGDLGLSRAQVLGDLKLVCSNGHRFKIIDSIRFGQTHIGYNMKSRLSNPLYEKMNYSKLKKLLNSSGISNLNFALTTEIPYLKTGQTILTRIRKEDISPTMKNFADWDGIWDFKKGLSDFYYVDNNQNYYIFGPGKRDVVWGDGNISESSVAFLKKDRKTELLLRTTPLKDSDSPSDNDDEFGNGPTLTDKAQVQEYARAQVEVYGSDTESEASYYMSNLNDRAKLDFYYTPIIVTLQAALMSVKDLCDRSTSTSISAPLHGGPALLKNEEQIIPIVKDIIKNIYIRQAEKSDAESLDNAMVNLDSVVNDAFTFFTKNYLDYLRSQDLRFLSILDPSISPVEKDSIIKNILLATTTAVEINEGGELRYSEQYGLKDFSSRMYEKDLKNRIQNELFSQDLMQKIDKIVDLIKSNIKRPRETATRELIAGESRLMVSDLQGSEYIGRVMMMSSALFIAEFISALYRKYLTKTSSNYIGVDIGIDLSSPDNIISNTPGNVDGSIFKLDVASISSIPTTFPVKDLENMILYDQSGDLIEVESDLLENLSDLLDTLVEIDDYDLSFNQEKKRLEEAIKNSKDARTLAKNRSKLNKLKEEEELFGKIVKVFISEYSDKLSNFLESFKIEMSKVQIASTNQRYTEKAVELIRESLLKKVSLIELGDNPSKDQVTALKITKTIINRCITNAPITTISLVSGEKYHAHYAGNESGNIPKGGPFRLLSLFNADTISISGLPDYAPPIFVISSQNNSASNLGVQFSQAPPTRKHVILYKDIESNFIEPYPTDLPDDVVLSGWKTGLVDSKKFSVKYEKEISIFYHPFTVAVLNDGSKVKPSFNTNIAGFVNSHIGFNSINGFHFGPQATRSGVLLRYPPVYAHKDQPDNGGSHVGLLLPIEYGRSLDKFVQNYIKIPPFFDAKIPIELPTDVPGDTIRVNISDFLTRSPPSKAEQILQEISARYKEYKEAERNIKSSSDRKKLRDECKKDVAKMFDIYRHLPYNIVNTPSSSCVAYTGKMGSEQAVAQKSVTPYIPMADFITCHRILNYEEFSPEFGGHNFWSENNNEMTPIVKGAIEQMIINSHNLEELAAIMNKRLNDNEIQITSKDLLDPHHLFDKIAQKAEKDKIQNFQKLVQDVTGYPLPEDYIPLSRAEGKDDPEGIKLKYRSDIFWDKESMKQKSDTNKFFEKFGRWAASIGKFYLIRSGASGSLDEEPGARIKVMSTPFPFNDRNGTGNALELQQVQDPNSGNIFSQKYFDYSTLIYGQKHIAERVYFPGGTPEEAAEARKELEGYERNTLQVSAVKYAAAISDFFSTNIITNLRERIQIEKARRDIMVDVESIKPISKKASLIKNNYVKVRVAPMEAVDNIRVAGMISLLSMFSK